MAEPDDKEKDEALSRDGVRGLIPEIYYDLIARVASGVPFVVAFGSQFISKPEDLEKLVNPTSFLILTGLGFVAGHLLTTISYAVNHVILCPCIVRWLLKRIKLQFSFRSFIFLEIFEEVYEHIDWATKTDPTSGTLLKKMEAGAALTDNLLSTWLILGVCLACGGQFPWWVSEFDLASQVAIYFIIGVVLAASVLVRRASLIFRQDRILKILGYVPE
jgi:hypothetical protein